MLISVFAGSVVAQVKTPCAFYDFFPLLALLLALSKLFFTHVLTLVPQLCLSLPVMALQWHLFRCVSALSVLCWVWPCRLGISTQPLAQLTVSCNNHFSYLPWGLGICCAICLGVSPSYLIFAPHQTEPGLLGSIVMNLPCISSVP